MKKWNEEVFPNAAEDTHLPAEGHGNDEEEAQDPDNHLTNHLMRLRLEDDPVDSSESSSKEEISTPQVVDDDDDDEHCFDIVEMPSTVTLYVYDSFFPKMTRNQPKNINNRSFQVDLEPLAIPPPPSSSGSSHVRMKSSRGLETQPGAVPEADDFILSPPPLHQPEPEPGTTVTTEAVERSGSKSIPGQPKKKKPATRKSAKAKGKEKAN